MQFRTDMEQRNVQKYNQYSISQAGPATVPKIIRQLNKFSVSRVVVNEELTIPVHVNTKLQLYCLVNQSTRLWYPLESEVHKLVGEPKSHVDRLVPNFWCKKSR